MSATVQVSKVCLHAMTGVIDLQICNVEVYEIGGDIVV
jgi:hypothetical protein